MQRRYFKVHLTVVSQLRTSLQLLSVVSVCSMLACSQPTTHKPHCTTPLTTRAAPAVTLTGVCPSSMRAATREEHAELQIGCTCLATLMCAVEEEV